MSDLNDQINQQIQQSQSQAGYGVSLVPYHTHNGTDSPRLPQTIYSGIVFSDGTTGGLFPNGWTVTFNGSSHLYIITHNLSTTNYTVVTCFATVASITNVVGVTDLTAVSFTVRPYVSTSGTATNSDFYFIFSLT